MVSPGERPPERPFSDCWLVKDSWILTMKMTTGRCQWRQNLCKQHMVGFENDGLIDIFGAHASVEG